MEDDKVAIIEAQLAQAKQIADEADRKYEEVKRKTKTNLDITDSSKQHNTFSFYTHTF